MKKKLKYHPCPSVDVGEEENCERQINEFGTYEVQKTSDTDNFFPAIAQGSPTGADFVISQEDPAYQKNHR